MSGTILIVNNDDIPHPPKKDVPMATQQLLSMNFTPSVPLESDLLYLPVAALAAFTNASYETVWDLANRVCDRYLPSERKSNRPGACAATYD